MPTNNTKDTKKGTPDFKAGDRVKWAHVSRRGSQLNISERDGILIGADDEIADVKMRNGHVFRLSVKRLRPGNEEGPVTAFFVRFCEAVCADANKAEVRSNERGSKTP